MKLVKYPNDFLLKKVKPFDWDRLNPIQISEKMKEIMLENNGIGISANQVAIDASIFIMKYSKEESIIVCINPRIISKSEETLVKKEGCLSFPDIFHEVERPCQIKVEFLDIYAQKCIMDLGDIDARCFMHEYDHLDGRIFLFNKEANKDG